jgi:lipoprotein-releasing system permease protein
MLARRRQTLLTLLGIFFGTAAFISLSGLMLGFREFLIDQLVNNSAHVHIQVREEFLTDHSLDQSFYGNQFKSVFWNVPPSGRKDYAIVENPQSWYKRLEADPRVEGFSPQLTASVIFSKGKATAPGTLIGSDPVQQVKITTIGNYVTEGKWNDLAAGGNRIILGDDLRRKLGVRLYQNILVSLANARPTPFKVVAFFKTGNKMADSQAYGGLADVQRVNRTPNQVNEISVRLRDFTQSAQMATAWSKISPEKVESWDQQNASFLSVFFFQDIIRYLSIGVILVVAGFGIYNILNMTVMHKKKDIAILRSMGYATGDIVLLFFSQGLILGLLGSLFGLVFGYFFSNYLSTIPFQGGPAGGNLSGTLMISRNPNIYIQAGILGVVSSCIAAILPARSAGRLAPIDIIRAGAE